MMTESNSYDYQEIVLVVYELSNDDLLKPIHPLVERTDSIKWGRTFARGVFPSY